jgi:uncharacterized repeat protein (TIGR04138 family)
MHRLFALLKKDRRYPLEAYHFVQEALTFAQDVLEMGAYVDAPAAVDDEEEEEPETEAEASKHLTGQQLCEAIRQYAVEQYGYMALVVLKDWGITTTSDFGEIVYNLIGIGSMKKSARDRREDFDDVYDFDEVFRKQFQITRPD